MTDKRILKHKMRTRRAKKKSRFDSLGRIVLGISLVLVVLLFGASFLGLFETENSNEPAVSALRRVTDADWEPTAKPDQSGTIVNKVTTWVNEKFDAETGLQVDGDQIAGQSADGLEAGGAANLTERLQDLPPQVKVYVANGCGVNRFAARFMEDLREADFDVWGVTDADRSDYALTLIIDRAGKSDRAQEVCSYFQARWGVGRVLMQERSGSETDVLVVLGRDLARAVALEAGE